MRPQMEQSCPMQGVAVVDAYFLEHRAKVLDIAAFLERVARAQNPETVKNDFRLIAMRKALAVLVSDAPEKARKVQMIFSDPTTEPLVSAAGLKGAYGAYPGREEKS